MKGRLTKYRESLSSVRPYFIKREDLDHKVDRKGHSHALWSCLCKRVRFGFFSNNTWRLRGKELSSGIR